MIDMQSGSQYWVFRHRRPYVGFYAHFDDFDSIERDGQIAFAGDQWSSQTNRYVSAPFAVMDDFGTLRAANREALQ